jgi:hypothetical protein
VIEKGAVVAIEGVPATHVGACPFTFIENKIEIDRAISLIAFI